MRRIFKIAIAAGLILLVMAGWMAWPHLNWPDRRPIGALFLASYAHRSAGNPRGWFNNPGLDVVGAHGSDKFRAALLNYADRSIALLKSVKAQGMIVWDLEGQEFPQKTSYIGDPRLVETLAPEMTPVVDEFFQRFREAGLRVGMTIRPQELVLEGPGRARQASAWDAGEVLLRKIDYAHRRWGATLFYIDSNRGFLEPWELVGMSRLAQKRPGVLLIPEHHQPLYYGFSAPYAAVREGDLGTPGVLRFFYPHAFQVLDIAGALRRGNDIAAAYRNGDILLFPGWVWNKESEMVKGLTSP